MNVEGHSARELAATIRRHALAMTHRAQASHIGSCLSIADVMAVLYSGVLRVDPLNPVWPERDRFLLSKGHAAAALYAALAERGFFPKHWLESYCDDGAPLSGHVTRHLVPGVDVSTGALGHGLSLACGMALAGKRDHRSYRVFVVLSDGECDEGAVWEAALFAPHHCLDNLVVIIDYNGWQSLGRVNEVLDLHPLAEKWRAFRWSVVEVDGHDSQALTDLLSRVPTEAGMPTAVIAHTVKGKGIAFMEDDLAWHYKSPNDDELIRGQEALDQAR